MVRTRLWLSLLGVLLSGTPLYAQQITWQDAVARLAQEQTQAETCVSLLKKYGDAAAIDRGSVSYGEAKAEYDAVIAGLIVVLAQKGQPERLSDLQGRLQRGFDKRETFCKGVQSLVPPASGNKGALEEIVAGVAKPIIDAVKDIYLEGRHEKALTRMTIQTQLEATKWPTFASVARSS